MVEIIFIGTLHCGFTSENELGKILKSHAPSLILVELKQKDLYSKHIRQYPAEMIYTVNFAKENNIPVQGFDSDIDISAKNSTAEDEKRVIQEQSKIINQSKWKEFNKEKQNKKLMNLSQKIIDQKKWNKREQEMKKNILKALPKEGKVLLITGTGHIPFFKKQFPEAKFPLSE